MSVVSVLALPQVLTSMLADISLMVVSLASVIMERAIFKSFGSTAFVRERWTLRVRLPLPSERGRQRRTPRT
jgi:hypothetical protein